VSLDLSHERTASIESSQDGDGVMSILGIEVGIDVSFLPSPLAVTSGRSKMEMRLLICCMNALAGLSFTCQYWCQLIKNIDNNKKRRGKLVVNLPRLFACQF
jgi:hypothetical protein